MKNRAQYFAKASQKYRENNPEKAKKAMTAWQKKYPERMKHSAWKSRLKRDYGLTMIGWEQLLKIQKSRCATCLVKFSEQIKPHVDHDHKTGLVRGLLCRWCNLTIGHAKDDPKLLKILAKYLERKIV